MGTAPVEAPDWWTTDHWATPWSVVVAEAKRLGLLDGFDLDVCARDDETAKAEHYWAPEDDGLKQPWMPFNWCNPPHSDPEPWVQRAALLAQVATCTTVMLLPPATSTGWFHQYIWDEINRRPRANVDIHFRRGRISFLRWDGQPGKSPRHDNMIVTFWASAHAIDRRG